MHKSFYASGFLYSLKTHQILLLQSTKEDTTDSVWSLLGGESKEGEDAKDTFQRIVRKKLKVDLKPKHIHPIYDYLHDTMNKINYVFYAEVKSPKKFKPTKENVFLWVAFSETAKLQYSTHTKQDVIVGERVINLKRRLEQNLQ